MVGVGVDLSGVVLTELDFTTADLMSAPGAFKPMGKKTAHTVHWENFRTR